jgi:hypothetical protein
LGTGGGIITKKLLFAVLLIAGILLTGIAGVSDADVGNAKTQDNNTHTVKKNIKTQLNHVNIFNNTTKTQTKVNKRIRFFKKENNTKNVTTRNKNTVKEIIRTHITDTKKVTTKKVASAPKDPKSLKTKNVVSNHSTKKSVNKQVNTVTTTVTNDTIKNSVNTQVNTTTITVNNVPAKTLANVTKKQKKYKVKKWYRYHGKWKWVYVYKTGYKNTNNSKYQYAAAGSTKVVKSTRANTSSIRALAASLTRGTTSKYKKGTKIFNWVRDHIRYSFYYNTKYGASGTLKHRSGNCVDHSHLIVALSRAAGLQAKYAHGKVRFPSGKIYGHVWALVKVNGKWYKADATSSRNSFGVMKGKVVRSKGVYNKLPF